MEIEGISMVNDGLKKKNFKNKLSKCEIINLPLINDQRGNLTFIEENRHIPFRIKRIYYLYDVPGEETRGGHAHKSLQQFIIAVSGSFDVVVDDGLNKKRFHLSRADYGLYIPTMLWRDLENFSQSAVCLVLASEYYKNEDYIRDYNEFKNSINN
jgi:dTDP-4-dehydrorhamnose 3,5-epimerase-like enzyme